jgi:hypothetical protein
LVWREIAFPASQLHAHIAKSRINVWDCSELQPQKRCASDDASLDHGSAAMSIASFDITCGRAQEART